MKIAIFRSHKSFDTIRSMEGVFSRSIHINHLGKIKGMKSVPEEPLELYVFDRCNVSEVLPNLASGFKSVVMFDVEDAQLIYHVKPNEQIHP